MLWLGRKVMGSNRSGDDSDTVKLYFLHSQSFMSGASILLDALDGYSRDFWADPGYF